jgi:hypothetical protein
LRFDGYADDDVYDDYDEEDKAGGLREMFIDRDPTHFRNVLNYLRSPSPLTLTTTDKTVLNELTNEYDFYGLTNLCDEIKDYRKSLEKKEQGGLSNEKEFKITYVKCPDVESVFKKFVTDGYELSNVIPLNSGSIPGMVSSPGTPTQRNRSNSYSSIGGGGDDGGVYMVFEKSLTKADVSFFDRIMRGS